MITEIVTFPVPPDISREKLLERYRGTVERWTSNPDLIGKQYFFNAEEACGGGVYFWKSRTAQQRWHGKEYLELIRANYGAEPRIECFETMIVVDNLRGSVEEPEAE